MFLLTASSPLGHDFSLMLPWHSCSVSSALCHVLVVKEAGQPGFIFLVNADPPVAFSSEGLTQPRPHALCTFHRCQHPSEHICSGHPSWLSEGPESLADPECPECMAHQSSRATSNSEHWSELRGEPCPEAPVQAMSAGLVKWWWSLPTSSWSQLEVRLLVPPMTQVAESFSHVQST